MVSHGKGTVAALPVVLGVIVCLGLFRSGFLAFLFVTPLGVLGYCYNPKTAWFSAAAAAALNAVFALVMAGLFGHKTWDAGWDLLYFTVMAAAFTWITAPGKKFPVSVEYRFAAGAVAGSLSFVPLFLGIRRNQDLYRLFRSQAEGVLSLYAASTDVVERSLLERYLSPDSILKALEFVALRGGAVASCVLFLFLSRQIALTAAWFIRRVRTGESLLGFHADGRLIWILSGSLLGVLLGLVLKLSVLEIAAWNVLTLCAILYLAQGGGIVLFFLARLAAPPLFRLGLQVLFFVLLFSPGINLFFLGALVFLGIAENWLPLRAPQSDGSSSTPGM
jgi:hypothetical protein